MDNINKAWSYKDEKGEHIILSDGSHFYSYHGSRSSFILDKETLVKRIENKKATEIKNIPFWVYNIIKRELDASDVDKNYHRKLAKHYEKQLETPSQNDTK